jgi:hypothetical protein
MIPIYQRVAPNEHAIGKPVTQSLVDRLRRNPLAILGIDEDDEAPVLRMQGMIASQGVGGTVSQGSGGGASEITGLVSVVTDGMEWIEGFSATCNGYDDGDGGKILEASLNNLAFFYSSNVPTVLTMNGTGSTTEGGPINRFPNITLPVDGAYHVLLERNVNLNLSARASFTAGQLLLTLRVYGVSGSDLTMGWTRRYFRSKALP